MAIAATVSLPLTTANRRSLSYSTNSFRFSSPISPQQNTLKSIIMKNPSFGTCSASSIRIESAPEISSPPASFLHRKESSFLQFVKYHGLGNDFMLVLRVRASLAGILNLLELLYLRIVPAGTIKMLLQQVDNRDSVEPKITPEQAVKLCDRNFGIGADGVIFALPGINGTDYTMRIFNSDGSEPEMCGNGVRCFARFIAEIENLNGKQRFIIHTGAGLIVPEIQEDGKVRVDMGEPILKASSVPTRLPPNKDQAVVKSNTSVTL